MVLASDINGDPLVGRASASFTTAPRPPVQFCGHSAAPLHTGVNKNTNWLSSPGSWAFYAGLIIFGWLLLSLFMDGGLAWTWIHIIHSIITFYVFHWMKFDDGMQNTPTRKFFTAVPVVTFLLAIHGSDYRQQPLFLNLLAMIVSVVSKFPALHKVRLFGINKH